MKLHWHHTWHTGYPGHYFDLGRYETEAEGRTAERIGHRHDEIPIEEPDGTLRTSVLACWGDCPEPLTAEAREQMIAATRV